jgi:hypothetical protein
MEPTWCEMAYGTERGLLFYRNVRRKIDSSLLQEVTLQEIEEAGCARENIPQELLIFSRF